MECILGRSCCSSFGIIIIHREQCMGAVLSMIADTSSRRGIQWKKSSTLATLVV